MLQEGQRTLTMLAMDEVDDEAWELHHVKWGLVGLADPSEGQLVDFAREIVQPSRLLQQFAVLDIDPELLLDVVWEEGPV